MNPENTLCLVVDVQERLLPALHGADEMVGRYRVPLQGMRALGVSLLATEQYSKGLGKTVSTVQLLLDGASVLEKTCFSVYLPQAGEILKQKRIANVVLANVETHIYMLQTVLDSHAVGLEVYVPFDCTALCHPDNKGNGLQQMRDAGAVVSNTESLLFMPLGNAGHSAFKAVSKLIRQRRRARIAGFFIRIEISDGLSGVECIGEAV